LLATGPGAGAGGANDDTASYGARAATPTSAASPASGRASATALTPIILS
jgi:hypothetical protein